jgi:hypothetical protein
VLLLLRREPLYNASKVSSSGARKKRCEAQIDRGLRMICPCCSLLEDQNAVPSAMAGDD